jgi:S1-C subfamily serine protease
MLPLRVTAYNHLNLNRGILIQEVISNRNVNNNQLATGDVIVGFNNVAVGSVDELYLQLNEMVIGKTVKLDVLKKGVKKMVEVVLGEAQ